MDNQSVIITDIKIPFGTAVGLVLQFLFGTFVVGLIPVGVLLFLFAAAAGGGQ